MSGVFSQCYNSDEERAKKLLVRVSPFWGRTTCLRLALEADDKNFVALSGVQVEQTSALFLHTRLPQLLLTILQLYKPSHPDCHNTSRLF